MAQTAAHLVDHVIPPVPVRQWVLSLPIPLRLLMAPQPKLLTPVLQIVLCVITRLQLGQAGLKADEADSGAVTLIQRFGSAANLNIHLHCLVLDGVYRRGTDGAPEFAEVPAPTDEALQAVLHKIITRMMKLLTHRGVLVEEQGHAYLADNDVDSDEARALRPLQAAPVQSSTVDRRPWHHGPRGISRVGGLRAGAMRPCRLGGPANERCARRAAGFTGAPRPPSPATTPIRAKSDGLGNGRRAFRRRRHT